MLTRACIAEVFCLARKAYFVLLHEYFESVCTVRGMGVGVVANYNVQISPLLPLFDSNNN